MKTLSTKDLTWVPEEKIFVGDASMFGAVPYRFSIVNPDSGQCREVVCSEISRSRDNEIEYWVFSPINRPGNIVKWRAVIFND